MYKPLLLNSSNAFSLNVLPLASFSVLLNAAATAGCPGFISALGTLLSTVTVNITSPFPAFIGNANSVLPSAVYSPYTLSACVLCCFSCSERPTFFIRVSSVTTGAAV